MAVLLHSRVGRRHTRQTLACSSVHTVISNTALKTTVFGEGSLLISEPHRVPYDGVCSIHSGRDADGETATFLAKNHSFAHNYSFHHGLKAIKRVVHTKHM